MERLIILQTVNKLTQCLTKLPKEEALEVVKYLKPIISAYKMQVEDELHIAERNSFEALQSDDGFSRATQAVCQEEEELIVLKNCLNDFLALEGDS